MIDKYPAPYDPDVGPEQPEYWDELSALGKRDRIASAPPKRRPRRVAKKIAARGYTMHYKRRCQHDAVVPGTWPEEHVCRDCGELFVNYDFEISHVEFLPTRILSSDSGETFGIDEVL